MWWNFRNKKYSYQAKTQTLVTAVSAVCAFTSVLVFAIGDYHYMRKNMTRDVGASSNLMANLMRLPFYGGDSAALKNIAGQGIIAFGLSKVVVTTNEGVVIISEPPNAKSGNISATELISLNNDLSPDTVTGGLSEGVSSRDVIGKVTVYTDGGERRTDFLFTLWMMSLSGILLWVVATYVGYLMTRKTTIMFDALVGGIQEIESGNAQFIDMNGLEYGAAKIASRVNDMGRSLYAREKENVELHRQMAEQMEDRAEKAERIMMAKLIQANKMSTLGLLVSSIAHEVNNPNTMIRLQIEAITRVVEDSGPIMERVSAEEGGLYLDGMPFEQARKILDENMLGIVEQSHRIDEVIRGLRDYVSKTTFAKKPVPVARIITRSLNLLQSQIKRGKCVVEDQVKSEVIIFANQFHIESVIINLLQNAFRAVKNMDEAGRVVVSASQSEDEVTISVTDNGIGIKGEDLPQLCDPFFSRYIEDGGTGLGLYITKGIMDDHKGSIQFVSELGAGTTVLLRFPKQEN